MPVRSLTALLAALVVTILGNNKEVYSQEELFTQEPDAIFEFDTDYRWFETLYNADLLELSPKDRSNRGFYFVFDRMHLMVSRPEQDTGNARATFEHDGFGDDFGWGNRYDAGWMGQNDCGWAFTYWSMNGPNNFMEEIQNRVNVINLEDPSLPNVDADDDPEVNQFGQLLPARDRNDPNFNERVYVVRDSVNAIMLRSFEMNRAWRLDSYRKGGILEPMAGIRYFRLRDTTLDQNYASGPGILLDAQGNQVQLLQETLTSQFDYNDNDLFGGQLGFRYIKFWNRFTHSCEFRGFAMQNFQNSEFITRTVQTFYDDDLPGTIDGDVQFEDTTEVKIKTHGTEFAVGFDLRVQTALQLTKSIQLRTGLQLLDFGRGILRGQVRGVPGGGRLNVPTSTAITDQNVWMIGYTFGLAINR